MPLAAGSHLGPYEVLALLGAGGMGEVYRAHDPALKRDVAIKILPSHTASDPERRTRFEREAQTIAALNHPNIVTVYSVEEADGVLCLVMELVEGTPLTDLIVKRGLPLTRLLQLAIPFTDAVSAAHQKGITHRDLKPANVMITPDGRVKVLDFGLAKLMEPSVTSPSSPGVSALPTGALTGEGRIVGTVSYMSPEQAEGKLIDHRSDIFSLGVMLYEMATGERPFKGDTTISTITSILRDIPRPITELNHELPRDLAKIVRHCLVKDPEYRYQSAKDVRNDLHELKQDRVSDEVPSRESREAAGTPVRVATRRRVIFLVAIAALVLLAIGVVVGLWTRRAATGGPIDSLAILPFVNVGADPNAEYLSDGITENLINSLSQLPQLRVVPRSTVFQYKGRQLDLKTIGRELTVRAVLTGRVVQRGETLNIQTDLIDVTGDAQLWGRQYTRTFADLITVQEEIATAVSEKLRLEPTTDEQKRLTKRYTENPEAHQLYLRGRYFWNRRTAEMLKRAAEYFQEAIGRDAGYALAWAGLADCYAVYSFYGVLPPGEAVPKAKDAASKALALDDTLAEPLASLGLVEAHYDWDWAGAERKFKRAIELSPNYATAHSWYSLTLEATGRQNEAIAEAKRALEDDPVSLDINAAVARTFYFARQYDRAIEQYRKTLEMDPNFPRGRWNLAMVYEQVGRYEEAIAECQKARSLAADETGALGVLGHTYAVSGNRAEALKVLSELKDLSQRRYVAPFENALIYVGLGDKAQAFEWLERAYGDHSYRLAWIKVDPRFDSLHGEPRFHDLLRRMRLSE